MGRLQVADSYETRCVVALLVMYGWIGRKGREDDRTSASLNLGRPLAVVTNGTSRRANTMLVSKYTHSEEGGGG